MDILPPVKIWMQKIVSLICQLLDVHSWVDFMTLPLERKTFAHNCDIIHNCDVIQSCDVVAVVTSLICDLFETLLMTELDRACTKDV